jgi:phage tail sheath gpL-like
MLTPLVLVLAISTGMPGVGRVLAVVLAAELVVAVVAAFKNFIVFLIGAGSMVASEMGTCAIATRTSMLTVVTLGHTASAAVLAVVTLPGTMTMACL